MDPTEKGWLNEYIQFRKSHSIDLSRFSITNHRNSLYKILQPTGLIYGQPIHAPGLKHPKEPRFNTMSKRKIVLLESFFHSAMLTSKNKPHTLSEWEEFYHTISISIGDFYSHLNPELSKKPRFQFTKKLNEGLPFTEQVLHKKLFLKSRWNPFWGSLFQNSLLFLDTYYFGEWCAGTFNNIKWHKDAMKIVLLKIIVAATHANHIVERKDKNIFFTFLASSKLTKDQEKTAKDAFRDGITLDQIDLRFVDTWLLKKYVLELTILMIWADKVITQEERAFLLTLAGRFGFIETDLDASLIAIESFVIENWKEVYFLQSKHSFQVINENIHKRIAAVMNNYKDNIIDEIKENQELLPLLEKSRLQTLDEDEKEKIRIQLMTVLQSVPSFETITLPGNFLTLPILLKVLPNEIFPSNF
ncbi:hypothetical protein JKA74_12790 [Marivirga sp. S37H4]|uniref:TerB family tellurite resistance protein n=1 Tax=Marivirga aurantiaca TaxID=2802615 RepID=A0A934WZW2_9BACT|nr:hypothetical protein [Marivirga aurantiaca]MBK6265912.1 hypothetical protein [Marivirga aurantiaca]